ncbi:MAG: hypothetical protein AB7U52_05480 [Candidatus Izemoplasmatales bacterium]
MIWFFGLMVIIQIALWIYFLMKKKYGVLIITGLLGVFSIWSYIDAYMKYVYVDPCEGISGCINETGMIFVLLSLVMLLTVIISLFVFILELYKVKNSKKNV